MSAIAARAASVRPPRRGSPFLDRNPLFATLALLACAAVSWDLWPDVAYALSSRTPIDLGAPGEYHLDRARPNRLHRVAGHAAASFAARAGGKGEERTVLGLAGTGLVVDRAGHGLPPVVYEGRLLPPSRRAAYAPFAAALRERGFEPAPAGEPLVLRDGELPGAHLGRAALGLLVLPVAAINLRALARRFLPT